MKLRVLLISLVALGLSASIAIAAPPPGKGKPASPGNSATAGKPLPTGPTCKPKVTVVLKGTLASVVGDTLGVTVTNGNRWARAYVAAGTATVTVTDDTKVRGNGAKDADDLTAHGPGSRPGEGLQGRAPRSRPASSSHSGARRRTPGERVDESRRGSPWPAFKGNRPE